MTTWQTESKDEGLQPFLKWRDGKHVYHIQVNLLFENHIWKYDINAVHLMYKHHNQQQSTSWDINVKDMVE